ncbi:MAG TPA: HIT family protein [Candidatus Thermoplasmatota archaeon]|nr:HIT family protein [Candidatus Thermoplasmatota archaeon]
MDCLFCAIAAGRVPSAELYQDERAFAFLDINPLAPGHALVVPKAHAERLEAAAPADATAVLAAAQRLLPVLAAETGSPDFTLAFNNGPAAGQEVPHLHLHVVPRRPGDGAGPVHALFARGPRKPSSEELHDLAIRVQSRLEGRPLPRSAP